MVLNNSSQIKTQGVKLSNFLVCLIYKIFVPHKVVKESANFKLKNVKGKCIWKSLAAEKYHRQDSYYGHVNTRTI